MQKNIWLSGIEGLLFVIALISLLLSALGPAIFHFSSTRSLSFAALAVIAAVISLICKRLRRK
jgi:low affinity Fe/Cu permease